MTDSVAGRCRLLLPALMALSGLVLSGCTSEEAPGNEAVSVASSIAPDPGPSTTVTVQSSALPGNDAHEGCTVVVEPAPGSPIQAAVDGAGPGEVVCVTGDHGEERTFVTSGGGPGRRLIIRSVGDLPARTAGFVVRADHVELSGFDITTVGREANRTDGSAILLSGTDIEVAGNRIDGTAFDGIVCEPRPRHCRQVRMVGNTVLRVDGTGIVITGEDVVAEGNEVAFSFAANADDADGFRFFGTGHRIVANYVHDIRVMPGDLRPSSELPHYDCFQTFDISGNAVERVTIEGNVCLATGDQCLIATAGFSAGPTVPERSVGLVFRGNVCDTQGSQAVLLVGLTDAAVTANLFLDQLKFYGVAVQRSTSVQVVDNSFVGSYWPYWWEESEAVTTTGNLAGPPGRGEPVPTWSEPLAQWGVDPGIMPIAGADGECAGVTTQSGFAIDQGQWPMLPPAGVAALCERFGR